MRIVRRRRDARPDESTRQRLPRVAFVAAAVVVCCGSIIEHLTPHEGWVPMPVVSRVLLTVVVLYVVALAWSMVGTAWGYVIFLGTTTISTVLFVQSKPGFLPSAPVVAFAVGMTFALVIEDRIDRLR